MEATVNKMISSYITDTYFDSDFRNVLEDHMTFLRNHPETAIVSIKPIDLVKYAFDLTGLLNNLNIPINLHWVVARMNGMYSLTEVKEDMYQILVPSSKVIENLRQVFVNLKNAQNN